MRSVTVRLEDLKTMILNLGFVGENEHRTFNFDCKKMFGEYPSASVSLTVQPPAGDCYPATVERNGDLVSWTVTDSDLIEEGCGEIQLTFMVGEVVAKTCIGRTKVERSLGATGDIPTPIENWIEQAEEVISEAEAATAAAEGAAEHQPIIDDNGYWAVWDADAEEYVATEYKAQGTDGHDGVGIVSIEKTGTSGLVDTYTITFTSGNPVTYTVTNGRDADPTEIIDDNAGAGDTDKVWSADKSHELLTEINSKADEPTGTKSAGKVYGLDSNLNPAWVDGGGGGGGSVDPQDIAQAVADWCDENITEDPTVVIDKSLQTSGAAADSLVAGGAIKQLQGMVSSIGENLNLFDALSAKKNGRLSDLGVFVAIDGYFTSDYIPVKYGRTYTKNSQSEDAYHRYALYSSASESGFITSGLSNSITIDSVSEKYIRFCGPLSEIGTTYFNTFTPSAIDSTIRYMAECMSNQLRADVCSIGENLNLFDIVTAKKNGRMNESGVFVEVDDFFTSDYIPVENGKTYYKNSPTQDGYHRYCLYSSASESGYISESASNSNTITINNANAHYLRFSGRISEIGTARIYTGTTSAVDVKARESKEKIDYYAPVIEGNYDASHWFKESPVSITANEKGYIDSNGTVQSINASYYYSDMISVSPGERYHIKGTGIGTAAHYWCLYKDGVKVEISEAGTESSSVIDHEFYLTIPYGANQLRTCWVGASTNCEIYKRNGLALSENVKSISILFVGNSLTQDGIAYLPYMLKHYYPEVNFKLYMWYIGGATLAGHYGRFENNTVSDIFSVAENSEKWTNYNMTRTMSTVLSTYKFDIVCLQEYFNNRNGYTDSDLADFNDCRDYIVENYTGGNALEFITLFHAPKRENTDGIFSVEKTGNGLILQKTITQDMIPNGIAVYRALSTDLDDLGDQGHLSPDGVHTQEGLPCLLQTYVTLCWLFEKLAINKSVYGCPFRMTTAIYNTLNVPGPNLGTGVITGTDAQNLLAQEVAIKAYKEGKKFVLDNLIPE